MWYQVKEISFEEAKKKAEQYPYGLVYLFDKILLGNTETIKEQICWEDCTEARFFSEQGELHIFDYNGEQKAVCIEDIEDTAQTEEPKEFQEVLEREKRLNGKFGRENGYQSLKIKEYLGCDEDGQVVVLLTRLAGLK